MERMVRYSFNTDPATGAAAISVLVPGTFAGLTRPPSGSTGRLFMAGSLFCGSPEPGDYGTGFQVVDTDGVVPLGLRGNFPNYPVISNWADPGVDAGHVGVYLNPEVPTLITPLNNNNFAPSGLYLIAIVQKASATSDRVYLNIIWDDLT